MCIRDRSGYALPLALAALLLVLTVVPVLTVIVSSFRPSGLPLSDGWTLQHFAKVWSTASTYRLVADTLIFAAVLAWLVERTDMPGRDLFRAGILMPIASSSGGVAIGII